MAEKEEVTVDKLLLQSNIETASEIFAEVSEALLGDLIVKAVEAAYEGKEFDPSGITMEIGKCDNCEKETEKSSEVSKEASELAGMLGKINKMSSGEPSREALDSLVEIMDDFIKRLK